MYRARTYRESRHSIRPVYDTTVEATALKTILTFLGGLLIVLTVSAEPAPPLQALQIPIDQIIATLKDPQFREESRKDAQRERIQSIINDIFDFDAIARLAVGRYWKSFKSEERSAFAEVFGDLIRDSYIERMQEEFKNEKIAYLGEQRKSPTKSRVETKIIRESMEIPIKYSMWLKDDLWKVYDVNIEGVSLVKNYRTQFSKILLKRPPAELIEQVRKKVRNLKNRREQAGK